MTKFQQIAGIEWLWLRISWESISSGERLKQYEEIILFFLFCFWGDNEGDGFLWIESTNWRIEIVSFWIFPNVELNQLKNWDDIILKLWLSLNWTNCRIEMILFWIFSIFSELNQPIEELRWYYLKLWQVREGAGDDAKCDEKWQILARDASQGFNLILDLI